MLPFSCMEAKLKQELQNIVTEINTILPNAKVFLFGSYATGKQGKWSDLDLCVVAQELPARRIEVIHSIRLAISDKTTLPLDILLFSNDEFEHNSTVKPMIEYTIAREGVLLNA
jgi:predicted nucleotidyltransferase